MKNYIIEDTWETIRENLKKGNNVYPIGAIKKAKVLGYECCWRLVDLQEGRYITNEGEPTHAVFELTDLLPITLRWNETNGINLKYCDSSLKRNLDILATTILNKRSYYKPSIVKSKDLSQRDALTGDILFLPSRDELFGEGKDRFDYYYCINDICKTNLSDNEINPYWLRSPHSLGPGSRGEGICDHACYVNYGGSLSGGFLSCGISISLCFAI